MRLPDADPADDNHVEHAVLGVYQLARPIRLERFNECILLLQVVLLTTQPLTWNSRARRPKSSA